MSKYIKERFFSLIPILLGISFFTFMLMQIPSEDVVDMMYKNSGAVSDMVKDATREELGLNEPALKRYFIWLATALKGDLGTSFVLGTSVTELFFTKLPKTLFLTLTALLITCFFSLPLGTMAAFNQNKKVDYLIRLICFLGNSMPSFLVAFLLLYLFALKLQLVTILNANNWQSFILPTLALAIPMTAKYTRHVRNNLLEELRSNYVYGALARGVSRNTIFFKLILHSLSLTLVTLITLSFGSLLGGTAIIEIIFMIDGIGKMVFDAIIMHDYPVIQAYVLWTASIFTLVNLSADIFYHYYNPQTRLFIKEKRWWD